MAIKWENNKKWKKVKKSLALILLVWLNIKR